LADVVVVTKADGDLAPAAGRAAADYRNALGLLRPRWAAWRPKVVACSSVTGEGIDDVAACLDEFAATVDASGELATQRRRQATEALWAELRSGLVDRLAADPVVRARIDELEPQVADGAVPPTAAARRILDAWGGHNS
jgi:LAO/AO transport system kinase